MLKLRMKEKLEKQYDIYRIEALRTANEILSSQRNGVSLTQADNRAYSAFQKWENNPHRAKTWDWPNTYMSWKLQYPKRFEAAAWKGGKLVGLSLGRPTYAGTGLRLNFIEKAPQSEISLLDITYIALSAYAALIGADHINIMHPVNAFVRDYYVRKGFSYNAKSDCCTRRV